MSCSLNIKIYWLGKAYDISCYDSNQGIFMAYHSPISTFFIRQDPSGTWHQIDPITLVIIKSYTQPEYKVILAELEYQIKQHAGMLKELQEPAEHRWN